MHIIDEENVDSKKPHQTGFFRDGKRRIDLVLVCKDIPKESAEQIKLDYLINAMSSGLQLEIETGMSEKYRHLMFIKVHSPEYLIRHFGYYYNMRKYFKESHLNYANNNISDEVNMVKVMRQSYPGPLNYSTLDRSLITYKILQAVTFGDAGNYVGLQRLLDHNIMIDVFPLHEGPYFLSKNQRAIDAHGRQALFYNWVGYRNLFRWQPIHIIKEYLGEKIAFLFAFFEYVNITLCIAGIFGCISYGYNHYNLNNRRLKNKYGGLNEYDYKFNGKTTAYDDLIVCKKCYDAKICPYRTMDEYEKEVKFKTYIDNPYNLAASYVTVLGLLLLYAMWRRKDHYLSWMWETNEKYDKKMPRPEYRPSERVPPLVAYSFKMNPRLLKFLDDIHFTKLLKKFVELQILLYLFFFFAFVYVAIMLLFSYQVYKKFHHLEHEVKSRKLKVDQTKYAYYSIDMIGCMNGIFIMVTELLWRFSAKRLTGLLNTRTYLDYERNHIFKLFGINVIINFSLIFFYAFIKGAFYTYPHDGSRADIILGLGTLNCGMGTCIDELYLMLISTFKVKKIYQEVLLLCRKRFFKTDAYPIDDGYSDIPCWEREYNLHPVTQDFFMHKMNSIFFMLCEGTFFICIFPLEAFIIFLFAVFEIRSWAKELIVHSRRPLIPQRWGLSLWKYVLLFMPFAAAFINSLTWVRHTHYLDRQMNDRYFRWVPERRFFADHYMGFFDFNDLTLTYEEDIDANGTRPDFCMFPGQYNRHIVGGPGDRKAQPMSYMPQAGKWYIHWHQALVVLIYLMMTVVAGLLITHLIEKVSEDTQVTMELEETLKQFHVGREPGEADDYLKPKKEMAQEMPKKEMAQDMPKPKGPKPKEQ